jgi:hypothetical protein
MIIHSKPFVLIVSSYIGLFVGFYLWTTLNYQIGQVDDLRYLFTALFVLSFLFFFPSKVQVSPVKPLILFIFYCCFLMIMHGDFIHAVLYILWLIYALIILPKLFSLNFEIFQTYVNALFYVTLALLCLLFLYTLYSDVNVYFEAGGRRLRYTSGLSNPSIYAKLVATSFWLSLLLFILSRRTIYLIYMMVLFLLLFLADMRTDLYGVIIGVSAFLVLNSKRKFTYISIIMLVAVSALVWIMLNFSIYDVDILLSGRIYLWLDLYNESGFGESVKVFLVGSGDYSEHYDSQWFEVLLKLGFIGFSIILHAFIYLFVKLGRARKNETNVLYKGIFTWGQALWIAFGAQGVTLYIFPSLGNTYNLILIPIIVAASFLAEKRRKIVSTIQ